MSRPRVAEFRLGVCMPYGVFSVARRLDPGRMGLLDGVRATSRKEADPVDASGVGTVPIDRLAAIAPACRISRARVVDAGRTVTAGGIAPGMELGSHLLRRAGHDEGFVSGVARVSEYREAYGLYRGDVELAAEAARPGA